MYEIFTCTNCQTMFWQYMVEHLIYCPIVGCNGILESEFPMSCRVPRSPRIRRGLQNPAGEVRLCA